MYKVTKKEILFVNTERDKEDSYGVTDRERGKQTKERQISSEKMRKKDKMRYNLNYFVISCLNP